MLTALSAVIAYVLGSIPSGLWLGRGIWHTDLREHGSHNTGATNAWRTLGKGPGFLIFLCDFLKGAVSVYLAETIVGTPLSMVLAAALAIVGHSCSLFMGFKGGKGVATGLGALLLLMPEVTGIVFVIWLIIVKLTGYVSLGSIVGAALVPILAFAFDDPCEYVIFGLLAAILIIVRHRSNISRLMSGTESKIKAGHR